MIDPARVVFYKPNGLSRFKSELFDRVAASITTRGGRIIRGDVAALAKVREHEVPVVGCMPECTSLIAEWRGSGRTWVYWDRGAWFRIFATWLPRDASGAGGMYRWVVNGFQMRVIRDVPNDRFKSHAPPVRPWTKNGRDIVVACPTPTYEKFHGINGWTDHTLAALNGLTDRQIVTRTKESKRPLQSDLEDAHCLIAHGSNAANEAVILGCPVIVDPSCAAALVGRTSLNDLERPVYPDRTAWLNSMAYSQCLEREILDGTVWGLLEE